MVNERLNSLYSPFSPKQLNSLYSPGLTAVLGLSGIKTTFSARDFQASEEVVVTKTLVSYITCEANMVRLAARV